MKLKNLAFFLAIAIIGTTMACAQQCVFADIPSGKGVQKVYVSQALMKMLGTKAFEAVNSDDVNMAAILKGSTINSVEVLNCEEGANLKSIRSKCQAIIKSLNLQVLVENSEDGEQGVTIYGLPDPSDPDIVTTALIYNDEGDEINCVVLTGKINFGAAVSQAMDNQNDDDDNN